MGIDLVLGNRVDDLLQVLVLAFELKGEGLDGVYPAVEFLLYLDQFILEVEAFGLHQILKLFDLYLIFDFYSFEGLDEFLEDIDETLCLLIILDM